MPNTQVTWVMRPEHITVRLPYFDEEGYLQLTDEVDFCEYFYDDSGNTTTAENEGLWYGQVLMFLQIYSMWLKTVAYDNPFYAAVLNAEGYGILHG